MSRLGFFKEAVKNFREVGTVTRSGKILCKKMASFLDLEDKYVLELGAGDGAITIEILKKLPQDGKLLCFEINPNMYNQLCEIKDSRFIPINDSAENMEKYMKEHRIDVFDSILSAIPYIVFREELAKSILNLCKKNLKKDGNYMQVHYAKSLVGLYKGVFGNLKTHRIYRNIPPAYAFQCINK